MNVIFRSRLARCCCVMAGLIAWQSLYADDVGDATNNVIFTWVPSFSTGHLSLTIKNPTDTVFKIARTLNASFDVPSYGAGPSPKSTRAGVIEIFASFVLPKNELATINGSGNRTQPIEIATHQETELKLYVDESKKIVASRSRKVILKLLLDDKVISSTTFTKTNGTWKQN